MTAAQRLAARNKNRKARDRRRKARARAATLAAFNRDPLAALSLVAIVAVATCATLLILIA